MGYNIVIILNEPRADQEKLNNPTKNSLFNKFKNLKLPEEEKEEKEDIAQKLDENKHFETEDPGDTFIPNISSQL